MKPDLQALSERSQDGDRASGPLIGSERPVYAIASHSSQPSTA
jgi:hypothetical protein